jgi:hypothetical protein
MEVERRRRKLLPKPRERKKIGNEIFFGQIHINISKSCNYQNALALSVLNPTLILSP